MFNYIMKYGQKVSFRRMGVATRMRNLVKEKVKLCLFKCVILLGLNFCLIIYGLMVEGTWQVQRIHYVPEKALRGVFSDNTGPNYCSLLQKANLSSTGTCVCMTV